MHCEHSRWVGGWMDGSGGVNTRPCGWEKIIDGME